MKYLYYFCVPVTLLNIAFAVGDGNVSACGGWVSSLCWLMTLIHEEV